MSSGNKFIKGGVIGIIIGAIAGILFAPKSGKETRQDIKNTAKSAAAETEKQLKALYKEIQQHLDELKVVADGASKKARTELDEIMAGASSLQSKLRETISNIREGEDVDEKEVDSLVEKAKRVSATLKKKATK